MSEGSPTKKRRRHSLAKILQGTEQSSLVAGEEEGELGGGEDAPELWLLQLPREVRWPNNCAA